MTTIDAYIPVREINARGLKARYQELFFDKPLLHHVIETLKKIPSLRDVVIVCDHQSDFLTETAQSFDVRIHYSTLEDIPSRARLRRSRLWSSHQWRGGIDYASSFDEDHWPHAFLAVLKAKPCDFIYQVSSDWICLDPVLSEKLIQYTLRLGNSLFTIFHQASPGLLGSIVKETVLHQMASQKMSLRDALAVTGTGKNNVDHVSGEGNFEIAPALSSLPHRMAVDSPRLHRWLENLAHQRPQLLEERSATKWAKAALSSPYLEGPPEEVEWEWQGPEKDQKISDEIFEKISDEILQEPDALITIDGRGRWLQHPHWLKFCHKLKEKKCHGLHLRLNVCELKPEHCESLLNSQADIISFIFDEEHSNKLFIEFVEKICADKDSLTGPLVVVEMVRRANLIPHWEEFWDHWFGKADKILWRPEELHLDKAPDPNLLILNRRFRQPCRKLERDFQIRWDGTIPLCQLDKNDIYCVGKFPDISLKEARSKLQEKLNDHRNNLWGTPCESCLAWDRLTP